MASAMTELRLLWSAEIYRALIDTRRYWTETAVGLVLMTVIFFGLLHGMSLVGLRAPGATTVDSLVVGFFMWSLASGAYGDVAGEIGRECTLGTIEQLALAPHSLAAVLAVRACVRFASSLATSVAILFIAMALSGHWVSIGLATVLTLACGLPALFGVGLALGGLGLLFKRITGFVVVSHLLLVFVIGLGAAPGTALGTLPFAATATLVLGRTVHQATIGPLDLAFTSACSAIYLVLGIAAFRAAERRARRTNTLEHY